VLGTIAVVGVFYVLTLRSGHDWGGDFSTYIAHAKNLATGAPYDATGYVFNPDFALYGPEAYPPVFPALLAPVYAVFGLNLAAMQIAGIVLFLLSLVLMVLVVRKDLPGGVLVALTALVGFNPFFWGFKEKVLSDVPILVFLFATFYLIGRAYEVERRPWRSMFVFGLLIGLFAYLTYGTRSIGIVVIPSLMLYDVLRARRLTWLPVVATATFVAGFLLQRVMLGGSNYGDLFVIDAGSMLSNLTRYAKAPVDLVENGYSSLVRNLLFGAVSLLALIGYLWRLRRRLTILEIFVPAYVLILIIWPYHQGLRYLIPVLPLYLFYALVGIEQLPAFGKTDMRRAVFGVVIAAVAVSYAAHYTRFDYGPLPEGVGRQESRDLFAYVRERTDPDDVFIFRKPRVLALFGARASSVYPLPQADLEEWARDFWRQCEAIGATHVVVATVRHADGRTERRETQFFNDFVYGNLDRFEEVYRNPDFEVYRIKQVVATTLSSAR
jgi:hypothetical protein